MDYEQQHKIIHNYKTNMEKFKRTYTNYACVEALT